MNPSHPWIKMDHIAQTRSNDGILKDAACMHETAVAEERVGEASTTAHGEDGETDTRARRRPWAKKRKSYSHAHFKVYKRRWFGLAQLVLLNVVVSWDVSYLHDSRWL
jgi:FLVCR family MFS transporter 7